MKRLLAVLVIITLMALIPSRILVAERHINDYPGVWANAPKNTLADSWGAGNRECVSYTAWKVYETFQYGTFGWGDAKFWPQDALKYGVKIGSIPVKDSVAIRQDGLHGHAMWVEEVNNKDIRVSQYNADGLGTYSEASVRYDDLTFIYFKKVMLAN